MLFPSSVFRSRESLANPELDVLRSLQWKTAKFAGGGRVNKLLIKSEWHEREAAAAARAAPIN